MQPNESTVIRAGATESILATNKVLRNTYILLALTLLFSAATAGYALVTNAPPLNPFITFIGYFVLLLITGALRNSALGILSVFALTGFLGYTLGPILNFYIHNFPNGNQIVMTAFGATGAIFLALSGYALVTRKDFSYLGGFIAAGMVIAFLASIASIFIHVPIFNLVVSAAFALLASGLILLQTSQIINNGETNYIMATITLYVSLYNLFLSLLQLFGAMGNRNN